MSGLKVAAVWDAISQLSIAGLSIKDIDQVTEVWEIRTPSLYPDIAAPLDLPAPTRQSFGTVANGAKKDVAYTLNYVFTFAPVGSTRGVKDIISGMFAMLVLIFNTVTENDALTGSVNIDPRISSAGVVVEDLSGNKFYGLRLAFDVTEFYEV